MGIADSYNMLEMEQTSEKTLDRRISRLLKTRIGEEPVVLLEGPRASGKSTVMRTLAATLHTNVFDFDNLTMRDDAARDPESYTNKEDVASDSPILIDEYQRVPAILDAIKSKMNRSSRPGQFVITGSARHDALPGSVQALTGRVHRMTIYPFAQSEMDGTTPGTVSRILEDIEGFIEEESKKSAMETRDGYIERIVKGGFPLAVTRPPKSRNRWFDDYIRQTVERDVPDIAKIRNSRGLYALLRKLAFQTAQMTAFEKTAVAAGIDISTARDYIRLLQDVFMLHELPAWGKTLGSRVAAKSKIHILDSGIAARLLGLTAEKLGAKEPSSLAEFGHLLETFVVSEILKEVSWLDETVLTGHWHTYGDEEVDLVVELMDGSIYGFEIKTSRRAAGDTFDGLAALRKFTGSQFKAGIVFYTGARTYGFDDRLFAVPVSKLWE